MSYLEEGSGTGSLVGAELDPNDLYETDYTSDDADSDAPSSSHQVHWCDQAINEVVPDELELADARYHGHFADHYAATHIAVDDFAERWTKQEETIEMPSQSSQDMYDM